MKATRLNKNSKNVKNTRIASKPIKTELKYSDSTDNLIGKLVRLNSIPRDIKRAKRLFEVGKTYKIQKPTGRGVNSVMSVYLKDNRGDIHQVQFMNFDFLFPYNPLKPN